MRRRTWGVVLGMGVAAAAGAAWWFGQADDFDYAAAFETPEVTDPGAPPGVVLAVAGIAGRSEAELASQLGRGDCEDSLYSRRCRYPNVDASVTYVDGKAEWILAEFRDSGYPLTVASLAALGLPEGEPAQRAPREWTWQDHAGFAEIHLYADTQGVVSHALVKRTAR